MSKVSKTYVIQVLKMYQQHPLVIYQILTDNVHTYPIFFKLCKPMTWHFSLNLATRDKKMTFAKLMMGHAQMELHLSEKVRYSFTTLL